MKQKPAKAARQKLTVREKWVRHRYRTVLRTIMDIESGAKREVLLGGADTPILQDLRDAGYRVIQQGSVNRQCQVFLWRILPEKRVIH